MVHLYPGTTEQYFASVNEANARLRRQQQEAEADKWIAEAARRRVVLSYADFKVIDGALRINGMPPAEWLMWIAVQRGADAVDKRFGSGWRTTINVALLDMRKDTTCILGQLTTTSYCALVSDMSGVSWLSHLSDEWQESHGFTLLGKRSAWESPDWLPLCRMWLHVIAGREYQV